LVVGNVFVGGVGKTPLVIALTLHFKAQGLQVAVISRGYSPKGTPSAPAPRLVTPMSQAEEVGDEPLLIFKRTGVPVCVGTHRRHAAQHVLQMHPQVQLIISDDGLQNNTLRPEMTVCVFDDRGTGNGWTLPAGPLREPWPRVQGVHPSQRALFQWVINTGEHPKIEGFHAKRRLLHTLVDAHGQRLALKELRQDASCPLIALAGVAQPDLFFKMLKNEGLEMDECVPLPDHATLETYGPVLRRLNATYGPRMHIVCTQKDAVKLWTLFPKALAIELEVHLPSDFLEELDRAVAQTLQLSSGFSNPANTAIIEQ
jgi:tetraacyldisaccharide 4'-kinase